MVELIKHGTWAVLPVGVAVAFVYLHVSAKVYPRLLSRHDQKEDGGNPEPPTE